MNNLPAISIVLLTLGGAIGATKVAGSRFSLSSETVRKMVHMTMGFVVLSFPWVFQEDWPVVVLCALAITVLSLLKRVRFLKTHLGEVLHGVERDSIGELLFPVGVAATWILSRHDPVLFCIPILILGLADALAALVGIRYGKNHYETVEAPKTVQGSLTFFAVALTCTVAPLMFSGHHWKASILLGLIMAILIMMVEAISWKGLDNLFIPLGGFAVLASHMDLTINQLFGRLTLISGLFLLVVLWRRFTTLNESAVLGAVLLGYVTYATADWPWMVAPAILFLTYGLFLRDDAGPVTSEHTIYVLLGNTAVGFMWMLIFVATGSDMMLYPYTVAYGSVLTVCGVIHCGYRSDVIRMSHVVKSALASWALMFLPLMGLWKFDQRFILLMAVAVLPLLAAGYLFRRHYVNVSVLRDDQDRWYYQAALVGGISLLGLIPFAMMSG